MKPEEKLLNKFMYKTDWETLWIFFVFVLVIVFAFGVTMFPWLVGWATIFKWIGII